jgi:hypothetical protein
MSRNELDSVTAADNIIMSQLVAFFCKLYFYLIFLVIGLLRSYLIYLSQ